MRISAMGLTFKHLFILLVILASFIMISQTVLAKPESDTRPGWGFGDLNHVHTGPPGLSVVISGNGAGSTNSVEINQTNNSSVNQSNNSNVNTDIGVNASTGGNSANNNTGGTLSVVSGGASAVLNVVTTVGQNIINL